MLWGEMKKNWYQKIYNINFIFDTVKKNNAILKGKKLELKK